MYTYTRIAYHAVLDCIGCMQGYTCIYAHTHAYIYNDKDMYAYTHIHTHMYTAYHAELDGIRVHEGG
jgi:hypothetical protein